VKLWDAGAGQEVLSLESHTAAPTRLAFSPDGGRLIRLSGDGTTLAWETGPRPARTPGP
jgi:WD40 repeat protein